MKTAINSILFTTVAFAAGLVQADTTVSEQDMLNLCSALQQDDVASFRREVRALYGREIPVLASYRIVAEDLRCNGEDAIRFALHQESMETARYLAGKAGVDLTELALK